VSLLRMTKMEIRREATGRKIIFFFGFAIFLTKGKKKIDRGQLEQGC
jgi:hypothetical protein